LCAGKSSRRKKHIGDYVDPVDEILRGISEKKMALRAQNEAKDWKPCPDESHPPLWKVFEAPSIEPVFPQKDQAIDYAQNRGCFRSGEIRVRLAW
jgi:hypothetical protein